MGETLFELPPVESDPSDQSSYTRRLTIRRQKMLAEGIHPTTRYPLKGGPTTCGNCAHHYERQLGHVYHKCDQVHETAGPATDVRVSWPACVLWAAQVRAEGDR